MKRPEITMAMIVATVAAQVLYNARADESCIGIRINDTYLKDVEGTKAAEAIAAAQAKWSEMLPPQSKDMFAWSLQQPQAVLEDLLAFCVARSVDVIARKGDSLDNDRLLSGDRIASVVGLDMSQWFTTTAQNYFNRISKSAILEDLRQAKIETTPAMDKAKKAELAAIAEREIAKTAWLPKVLRTPVP